MTDPADVAGYPDKVEGCYGRGSHFVYILRLFDGRWYVGETEAPKRRVLSHINSTGVSPHFVRQYPPVEIAAVLEFDAKETAKRREEEIAEAFAHYYGSDRVRGGGI